MVEAISLVGPALFWALFLVSYFLWNNRVPNAVAILVGGVLAVLALTPLMSGLGWMLSGHWYAGAAILLLRAVTLAIGVAALVYYALPIYIGLSFLLVVPFLSVPALWILQMKGKT